MVAMTITSTTAEPIISRLERLDNMLRQLEEIRGCNNINNINIKRSSMSTSSPKSSFASSTASSGTLTSDGHLSLDVISPKSLEKHCRPIEHVMVETDAKGTLIERLEHVEDRVLKLCFQLEEELEAAERKREQEIRTHEKVVIQEKSRNKKKGGLKQLVKQCVTGKGKPNKIK